MTETYAGITTSLEGEALLKMLKKERDASYRLSDSYRKNALEIGRCIKTLEEDTK